MVSVSAKCECCGAELKQGAKFCANCGTPVPEDAFVPKCPACGAVLPHKRVAYCHNCGELLDPKKDPDILPKDEDDESDWVSVDAPTASEPAQNMRPIQSIDSAPPVSPPVQETYQRPMSETERFMMEQQANAARNQSFKTEKAAKKDSAAGVIAIILAITLVIEIAVAAFVRPGWLKKDKGTVKPITTTGSKTTEKKDRSDSAPVDGDGRAVTDLGVSIDFSDSLDVGGGQVTVTSMKEDYSEDVGAYYTAYDISLGDVHQLDGYAEIRIPYTTDHIDAGQAPAQCVAAMYFNEDTSEWEPTLYEVDEASRELVIHTDHLSLYGCFNFRNEGKRMAKVLSIYDWETVDENKALAAMQEYISQNGEPGELCHDLAKPYAESALKDILGGGAAYTDKMTVVSNYANLIYGGVVGVSQGIESFETTKNLWKDFSDFGLYCAAVSIAIQVMNNPDTPESVGNLYKDCVYFMISAAGDTALGVAGSAVWFIDSALTDMNRYVYNSVKDDLKECYRWYMETDNQYHKPRTLKEWRKLFAKLCEDNAGNPEANLDELIMDEIDNYCGEFWDRADLWDIYVTLGQDGRGLPSKAMQEEITSEFKGELMSRLTSVLAAVELDMKYKMYLERQEKFDIIIRSYNTKYTIKITENVKDGEKSRYAGYSAYFHTENGQAIIEPDAADWTLTLDSKGCAETKVTWIGYVLAGCPSEVWLYPKGQSVGGEPEKKVSFVLNEGTTEIPLGDSELSMFLGSWYYYLEDELYKRYYTYNFDIIDDNKLDEYYTYEFYNYSGDMVDTYTYVVRWDYDYDRNTGVLHVTRETGDGKVNHYYIVEDNTLTFSDVNGKSDESAWKCTRQKHQ